MLSPLLPDATPRQHSRLPLILTLGFAVLVALLAILQWRWIKEIGWYELGRQQRTLQYSLWLTKYTFDRELKQLTVAFSDHVTATGSTGVRQTDAGELELQRDTWRSATRWPELLADIYRVDFSSAEPATHSSVWFRLDNGSWRSSTPLHSLSLRDLYPADAPSVRAEDLPPVQRSVSPVSIASSDFGAIVLPTGPTVFDDAAPDLNETTQSQAIVLVLDHHFMANLLLPQVISWFLDETNFGLVQTALIDIQSQRRIDSNNVSTDASNFDASDIAEMDGSITLFAKSPNDSHSPSSTLWIGYPEPNEIGPRSAWQSDLRQEIDPPGHWQLVVRTPNRPLPRGIAGLQFIELATAFVALILLGLCFAAVLIAGRKTTQAAEQRIELMARVSHELRTPIAVMQAAGENLTDGLITSDKQRRQYGELIQKEARRLRTLTENALHLAHRSDHPHQDELIETDLVQLVKNATSDIQLQAERYGVWIELDLEEARLIIQANPEAVSSALDNLLSNALKYGAAGEPIGVTVRIADSINAEDLDPSASVPQATASVVVTNRGLPIRPDELQHILAPYYRGSHSRQRQIEGSGLGLAVVREIMKTHRGRLTLTSSEASGTTATLHFPLPNPA